MKKNFRPISVLPCLSKIFERVLNTPMVRFMNERLSDLLCGFREKYSTQHALIRLIESCRNCLDNKGVMGMILMDLSKANDCLPHDLLIAKLAAYGFGNNSLHLICSYLSGRKQRVNIGSTFSDWLDITSGVPQGSILGPLLFNIFINDLVFFIKESKICNFADDNTIFPSGLNIEQEAVSLEIDLTHIIEWFDSNRMVANPGKFQVMFLGLNTNQKLCIENDNLVIKPTDSVKLLGITIDSKLKFSVKSICTKASKKVGAFSRVVKYLDGQKAKLLYNAFIMSTFNYCPVIWMFCGKRSNKKVNRVHKRALTILFNDYDASFEELLERVNERSIHVKNLQNLLIEVYNPLNCQNPIFMWDMFKRREMISE